MLKPDMKSSLHGLARLRYRGYFYNQTLRGRRPQSLTFLPEENWPGDAGAGQTIVEGSFRFLDHSVNAADAIAGRIDPGLEWRARMHGFDWLRDMRAVGTDAARLKARELVSEWIRQNQRWNAVSWRPDVLARRLCNWFTHAEFVSGGANETFAGAFLDSLGRQIRHLRRAGRFADDGIDTLVVLKATLYAALCIPGGARHVVRLMKPIAEACDRLILQDGGYLDRCPRSQLEGLRALIDLRSALSASNAEIPEALQRAIDRAAPMLRFFRHGDGGLALFNGSDEGEAWLIDVVLTRAEARGKPLASAPHSGFERITANRTLILVDAGGPPPRGFDRRAHAGTLSFELSVGKHRMVTNCGAYSGRDETWRRVQRATAAHSTLTVDDSNSAEIRRDGSLGGQPATVACDRMEADGNVWLDMSHDGYKTNGLVHRRRLYARGDGGDIRGEELLSGRGDHKFAVRFHLHPTVKASLVQGGAAVLLRLGDGSGWRMRCSGGVASLQESIYLGERGEAKRTEQIVINGATRGGEAQVKWALSKLAK